MNALDHAKKIILRLKRYHEDQLERDSQINRGFQHGIAAGLSLALYQIDCAGAAARRNN